MSLPRPPRAVVFDLDGLLIDSETMIQDAMIAVSPRFGKAVDLPFFLSLVGHTHMVNDAALRQHFGEHVDLDDFHLAVRAHIETERVAGAVLKTGVTELLDRLDRVGLPRAIATSSTHEWVDRHLGLHGLAPRFNAVIARGDYVNSKPHPEPYLAAAAQLDVAPEFCLALEDSYTGVRAAHAAGMMTIMVPDLLAPNDDMRALTIRIVDTLHEVADLFG